MWGRTQNFLVSGTILAIGFFLYAVLRPYHPYVIRLNSLFNFSSLKLDVPSWFIYNLPDGTWCASGAILINAFKKENGFTRKELFWSTIVLFIGLLLECLQNFGIVTGTFDMGDILFLFFGYFIALFYQKLFL